MQKNHLVVGQCIHSILGGGKDGVIIKINGEQSPESTRLMGGGIFVAGGQATLDIAWDNGSFSYSVPEALIHQSEQWRVYDEIVSARKMSEMIEFCESRTAQKENEAKQASIKFIEDKAALIKANPHLKAVAPGAAGYEKHAASNMRIELKKVFPGVKFSVTSTNSSVRISWEDGPCERAVARIANRHKGGHFDGMTDSYVSEKSPWAEAFGCADYIFTERNFSDDLLDRMVDFMYKITPGNMRDVPMRSGREFYQAWRESIPGLDIPFQEMMGSLSSAWDCVENNFSSEVFSKNNWAIKRAKEIQDGIICSEPSTDIEFSPPAM